MKYGPLGLLACLLAAHGAFAKDTRVHIYTNYDQSEAPGVTLPSGPDEIVSALVSCPGAVTPPLHLVVPAGATGSSAVISSLSSPLYQYMKLYLEQDYAVAPTRILWRFVMGNVGISAYMGPENVMTASFHGPDCPRPWQITLTTRRIKGAYSPDTIQGLKPVQTPFPDEP